MSSAIQSFFLEGPAGRLEALLNRGTSDATHAVLVAHPHPLFGGTLHNKVVFNAMKALNAFGFPVLRFNFRGTGLSEGKHDHGNGELDDIHKALDWLHQEFSLPLIFAGFSFGAAVGLRASYADPRVDALIGLGLPVASVNNRNYDFSFLRNCPKPKLFVSGEFDQFGSPAQLQQAVAAFAEPKQLILITGGDHFFEGHLPEMRTSVEAWVQQLFQLAPKP